MVKTHRFSLFFPWNHGENHGFPMVFSFTQVAWNSEEAQTLEVLAEEVGNLGVSVGGFSL